MRWQKCQGHPQGVQSADKQSRKTAKENPRRVTTAGVLVFQTLKLALSQPGNQKS